MSINPRFLFGMVGGIGLMILSGMFLGHLSVPKSQKILELQSNRVEEPIEPEVLRNLDTRLMASVGPASHLPSILIEAQYAHEVGLREFILQSPLPSSDREKERLRQAITGLLAMSEDTKVSLALDCNPSQSWLRENPEEASTITKDDLRYPSISSTKWKQITQSRLAEILNSYEAEIRNNRVFGITLQALEGGRWMRTGGYDSSDVHKKDFRDWLKRRYENIEALNVSWAHTSYESFDGVLHPGRIEYDMVTPTFYRSEDGMSNIDYHRFVDHAVLRFIAGLTAQIRAETDTEFEILAHAPAILEDTAPETGAWGRGTLETAGLNGTMTLLQSRHRQVGQHGYFASPVFQGTHTLSVDNTYTSIGYDTIAKSIKGPDTYITEHVYNLMARNAILSAISGTT